MGGLREDWRTPRPDRLAVDDQDRDVVLAAHGAALEHGEDGYVDPRTGWWVFSAAHLVDRGSCCGSGCRHCPYDDELATPQRST